VLKLMNTKAKMTALFAATTGVTIAVGGVVAVLSGQGVASTTAMNAPAPKSTPFPKPDKNGKVALTDAQWRQRLTPTQFDILRRAGTEVPYTHPYAKLHDKGTFICAGCGLPLFSSDTKFESGTGWPSFYQPIRPSAVKERHDLSGGMDRTEVRCSRCSGHLGHVFADGPKPTGLRYCMNGGALKFIPATKTAVVAPAADTATTSAATTAAASAPVVPAGEQRVSVDFRDTPLRDALEQLFRQTKTDASIDNSVQGYVTLKLTDQPLDTALRLIINRSSVPLTYSKESGVYVIKPRRIQE
jgi:peptide-methionine (R)-S-oxide reductase